MHTIRITTNDNGTQRTTVVELPAILVDAVVAFTVAVSKLTAMAERAEQEERDAKRP